MPAALLLTASAVASSSDVEALTKANGGEAPAVATRSTALSPSDFSAAASVASSSSFSLVRSLAASGHASAEGAGVLRVAAAALAPGGTLELAEEVRERERENGRNGSIGKKKKNATTSPRQHTTSSLETLSLSFSHLTFAAPSRINAETPNNNNEQKQLTEPLRKALLLAGFIETTAAAGAKEAGEGGGLKMTTARKPDWAPSAAVALPAAAAKEDAAAVSAWDAAAAAADGEGEEETIDEDALLAADGDLKPKIVLDAEGKAGACPPTKSACKDCSCGRAEREAANGGKAEPAPKLTREMIENPQSNCGSCGLGDAFRCGGCPYRGLPAFQPGKKIELPADFLVADT